MSTHVPRGLSERLHMCCSGSNATISMAVIRQEASTSLIENRIPALSNSRSLSRLEMCVFVWYWLSTDIKSKLIGWTNVYHLLRDPCRVPHQYVLLTSDRRSVTCTESKNVWYVIFRSNAKPEATPASMCLYYSVAAALVWIWFAIFSFPLRISVIVLPFSAEGR